MPAFWKQQFKSSLINVQYLKISFFFYTPKKKFLAPRVINFRFRLGAKVKREWGGWWVFIRHKNILLILMCSLEAS